MAMKQCKECGEEISSKAKVCPKCGYKPKGRRKGLPFIAILLIVIGIIWAISDGSKAVAASEETIKADIGEIITTNSFEATVTSVKKRMKVGSEFFEMEPSAGGAFIAVMIKYKNITDKPISSFKIPVIKLKDSNGTVYDADLAASGSYATEVEVDDKILCDLNPGITVNEAAVFEISETALQNGGWKIYIDADSDIYIPLNL